MNAVAAWRPAYEVSDAARKRILFAVLLGIFLSVLDQTIVATALPTIVEKLGGATVFTWVTTVYLLAATVSIPFYGKLSDVYGRRPLLVVGISVFLVGSVLSGLATDMTQLIAFRAIQGVGAGALHPLALAVIGDLYAPADRARPQSLFGVLFALAAIIGPTLGGFLTERVGWPAVFFVNLPVGLLALGLIVRMLPATARRTGRLHFDTAGATALVIGISALLLGLANKQTGEWTDLDVGGLILASLVTLVAFVVIESGAEEPILPPSLFADRTVALAVVASFFVSIAFYGAVVFLPLWFQLVGGASPTTAGFQILALLIGVVVGAIAGGGIVARTGRYRLLLLASTVLGGIGFIVLAGIAPGTPAIQLGAAMFVAGLGLGPSFSIFTVVVQAAVSPERLGVASAALTFFRQIGGSVGLAILGTLFGASVRSQLAAGLAASGAPTKVTALFGPGGPSLASLAGSSGPDALAGLPRDVAALLAPWLARIAELMPAAISSAVGVTFVAGVLATIVAVVAIAGLREVPLGRTRRATAIRPAVADAP